MSHAHCYHDWPLFHLADATEFVHCCKILLCVGGLITGPSTGENTIVLMKMLGALINNICNTHLHKPKTNKSSS